MLVSRAFKRALEAELHRLLEGENTAVILSKGQGARRGYVDAMLEVNGFRAQVFHQVVDYKEPELTPVYEYFIQAAWHHNPTNRVKIKARTLRGLVGAVRRYPYKLVRP